MSTLDQFVAYAIAFEQVLETDDWTALEPFFTPDAVHETRGGGPLAGCWQGRDAVIAGLRYGVGILDRRFDRRVPEVRSGPEVRGDSVWMTWRLRLERAGLPDLVIDGSHDAVMRDGAIWRLEEALSPVQSERLTTYLETHDARLRAAEPSPCAYAAPAPAAGSPEGESLAQHRMRSLVQGYARAKSRADGDAALAFCHDGFRLETVPFGIASHDRAETAVHLGIFFQAFPDYTVALEDIAYGASSVGCWGTARMTMRGDAFGIKATGATAEFPVACAFGFRDGLLASERFYFDLASLCDGIRVPVEEFRAALRALRDGGAEPARNAAASAPAPAPS